MISLTINGQTLEVPENTTILQAAEQAGIVIPTLCHHKDLTPYGGCRLCAVDVRGMRLPATACTMPVTPGMVVETESPELTRYRKTVLELLLVRFYDAGYTHYGSDAPELDTQFAHWVRHYGIDMQKAMRREPFRQIDSDPNPFIWVDKNKCIMCTRCVRACAEVQGRFVWTQAYRGYDLRIVAGSHTTMLQARCESCGACVAHCPTGALDNRMSVKLGKPDRTVETICPYCGAGCTLYLNLKDDVPGGRVISVTSNAKAPVNGDHLCVKGRYGYDFIQAPERIRRPRVRQYLLDGKARPAKRDRWVEVDWDTALDFAARGLKTIRDTQGPDHIGLLMSGKLTNEDNYLMNKFARQIIGTNNIDLAGNLPRAAGAETLEDLKRLAQASARIDDVAAHARSILVLDANITENHPVFGSKIRQAVLRRKVKIVAADPIFYNIDEYAALIMRQKRGTESALLLGLMGIMLEKGWCDAGFAVQHAGEFQRLKEKAARYPVEGVARLTGIPEEKLYQAAELLASNRPTAVICEADQAGPVILAEVLDLQRLTGNLDASGGGVAALRPQNNSQGATDMGGHPAVFPGCQPVTDEQARIKFEAAWATELPVRPGLTAGGMLRAAGDGLLKALFILGENGWPEGGGTAIRHALNSCEFVVLCEALPSPMSRYADVLLPGVTFAETSGTFTSTERRIQLVRQAIPPQGEARPAWKIINDLACRVQPPRSRRLGDGEYECWKYEGPAQIMDEIVALTPLYATVSHAALERGEAAAA